MYPWIIRFSDGSKIHVEAEDAQDALREGHKQGGPKYSIANIVEIRRI